MFEATNTYRKANRLGGLRRRHNEGLVHDSSGVETSTRLTSLSPSLFQDLHRFEQSGRVADLLETLAASLRHGRSLTARLWHEGKTLPLTVFPLQHLAYCPLELLPLLKNRLDPLSVLKVEPAVFSPPGDVIEALTAKPHLFRPLSPLLWAVALQGSRSELLPELTGAAVYRVSPVFDLAALSDSSPIQTVLMRLSEQVASLREIASWPGMGNELAQRLLNAVYLQSGLIISRSHPAALSDSWFSALTW